MSRHTSKACTWIDGPNMLISDSRFDLVWFRLSCDHGWIRSGSVNVRKQQQQQQPRSKAVPSLLFHRGQTFCSLRCLHFYPWVCGPCCRKVVFDTSDVVVIVLTVRVSTRSVVGEELSPPWFDPMPTIR